MKVSLTKEVFDNFFQALYQTDPLDSDLFAAICNYSSTGDDTDMLVNGLKSIQADSMTVFLTGLEIGYRLREFEAFDRINNVYGGRANAINALKEKLDKGVIS